MFSAKPKETLLAEAVRASIVSLALANSISHAATLTVNSNSAGSGTPTGCALREAVNAINNGASANGCFNTSIFAVGFSDTIVFDSASLPSNTITLTGREIDISQSVLIIGFDGLTIDGNQRSRIFNISNGVVNLNNLIIQNGFSTEAGGGIFVDESTRLTLTNSIVSGNTSDTRGGGIYNGRSSTLTLNNSSVSGNSSNGSLGGGISTGRYSSLVMNFSSLNSNSTSALGGGMDIAVGARVTLNNSNILNNSSSRGGGIHSQEGNVQLTINSSTISGNSANDVNNGSGGGFGSI